jgi:hypothetical protein
MEPDDLDTALAALQQSLSDALSLANILISMRRNADRLRSPLVTTLTETRAVLDHALTLMEDRP